MLPEFLAGVAEATKTSKFLSEYRGSARGILVLYVVKDLANSKSRLSVGFGIQFPGVKQSNAITWTVADPKRKDDVVVTRPKIVT